MKFIVIKTFATEDLQKLFFQTKQEDINTIEGGFLKKAYDKAKLQNSELKILAQGDLCKGNIPLILCESRESLKRKGILCPYEFVVERRDLLPIVNDKGNIVSDAVETLARRLKTLAELYSGEDFTEALKDWFAGAFRMYLMLDASTHGTSQFIDLEKVKAGKDPILLDCIKENPETENGKKLRKRFTTGDGGEDDEMKQYRPLAEILFSEYFETNSNQGTSKRSIVRVLQEKNENGRLNENSRLSRLRKIYTDAERFIIETTGEKETTGENERPAEHSERLPQAFGERAKYVAPTGKLNLLLIDDHVEDSPLTYLADNKNVAKCIINDGDRKIERDFSTIIAKDDWDLLRGIFNVQTMPVDKGKGDIYEEATKKFRKMQKLGLTYDLILVDLCLGNNRQGEDLDGYAMIRIARLFFPGTPIVVYSRFNDMEHIARAFFNGAKWFLVKGEEAKLPRHVLKLLKQVGWHREWRAIKGSINNPDFKGDDETAFFHKFMRTEEWKYLTYKSLESFPGNIITAKKMGGGISSAVTFKATKGMKREGEFLQTPSIIKIDTSYNTMMEFERYFRMIRPYIANESGRVEKPERVLNRSFSSIVYTFAGKQDRAHDLKSMGEMLDDDVVCQTTCNFEKYRYALNCIFDEILPKIHRVAPELEVGDLGRNLAKNGTAENNRDIVTSQVADAFEWKPDEGRITSFPNTYLGEFEPGEFWKSYMLRMQPWGRIIINDGHAFEVQKSVDLDVDGDEELVGNVTRLTFHNVMQEPFAPTLDEWVKSKDSDGKSGNPLPIPGSRIIEAYDNDMRLWWLTGDVCDFVARYRKHIAPGTSLWLKDKLEDSEKESRIQWLKDTFATKGKESPGGEKDFIAEVFCMMGIVEKSEAIQKTPKRSANIYELEFYIKLQDEMFSLAEKVSDNAKRWEMKCPIGIVHGDLNVKNIMLESRKHPPKDNDPDVTTTVSDVWLIDFARTRRDLITHDFNVFFTSVLGELFAEGLIGKEGKTEAAQETYWKSLVANFKTIVSEAVAPKSDNRKGFPDAIKDNPRFDLVYRVLRWTRDAALKAGVSQNMYLLTTALACLYTLKIFLNNGCKVRMAAGYFAAAWICYDILCKSLDVSNVMQEFKT